ncbi:hypothetical protein OJAV_G00102700 [Oryzias javanicus]|uniref:Uncharacterized protein n=1 Tax=Oryzias javanicus TaxID=123683 RepID=A0A3S2M3W1_ORYJA|nr:hypothetical protein OJAV_G00102700 [Oryzias javanicus]
MSLKKTVCKKRISVTLLWFRSSRALYACGMKTHLQRGAQQERNRVIFSSSRFYCKCVLPFSASGFHPSFICRRSQSTHRLPAASSQTSARLTRFTL